MPFRASEAHRLPKSGRYVSAGRREVKAKTAQLSAYPAKRAFARAARPPRPNRYPVAAERSAHMGVRDTDGKACDSERFGASPGPEGLPAVPPLGPSRPAHWCSRIDAIALTLLRA